MAKKKKRKSRTAAAAPRSQASSADVVKAEPSAAAPQPGEEAKDEALKEEISEQNKPNGEPAASEPEGEPAEEPAASEPEGEPAKEPAATEPEGKPADEHMVFLNVVKACEVAERKRNAYKKYGPLVVLITGIVFLTLMFTLDAKIEFLILWVVTDFYTVGLMIRAEYKYHQFQTILGLKGKTEAGEEEWEEEKQ